MHVAATPLTPTAAPPNAPPRIRAILAALLAIAAFHLACAHPLLSPLMVLFLFCTAAASRIDTPRGAFWLGLGIGFAIYAPQLFFFARIFHVFAISLWLILSVWVGFFTLFAHYAARRLTRLGMLLALPVLWTGLGYFRSELNPLRFTWLTPGLAFPPGDLTRLLGVYGIGFFLTVLAAAALLLPHFWRFPGLVAAILLAAAANPLLERSPFKAREEPAPLGPFIVGIQAENPDPTDVPILLDSALREYPHADLFMMSEYTFATLPPRYVRDWCEKHGTYLLVGGERDLDPAPGIPPDSFRDTAFVVGPSGDILFEQAKSVPIQFMADGLPAPGQQIWHSPWGEIGICVCYDLSYTRVTDRLERLGVNMILVPTMDVASWGAHEHLLHSRIGPARAAEYHLPIVRVCSSGISQIIDRTGHVVASAPFPGQGAMIAGQVRLGGIRAGLPCDRYLAPACSVIALAYGLGELALAARRRLRTPRRRKIPLA